MHLKSGLLATAFFASVMQAQLAESQRNAIDAALGSAGTYHAAEDTHRVAAFAGTDAAALVDGDFAMTANELQGVLKTLRRGGIHIVALHNHMTHEQPLYVFLHYWGKGPAVQLARTLRAALDTQQPQAQNAAPVVFVCEHGAAKNVMAAAYFNQLAQAKGLTVRALSRGTDPEPGFNTAVVAGLQREGLPSPSGKPQRLSAQDRSAARQVVFLSLPAPAGGDRSKELEWLDLPAVSAGYDAAAGAFRKRVEDLIRHLAR
jgi:hypothetical protein